MLQSIRDKATGILGWVIIGLIIITFALFGLGSYLQDKSRAYAARVNDIEITPRDLQKAYQQQRAQIENRLGDAFDPAQLDEALLRKSALESLIQKQLLLQQSETDGMTISDQYLATFIHSIPNLQVDGEFSRELYQQFLTSQGLSPAEFEVDMRKRLLTMQLMQGLSETGFVTDYEIREIYTLQNQKRDFDLLTVSHLSLLGEAEVSSEEAEAYYKDNTAKFMQPEKVKVDYIKLSKADLAADVEVDSAELENYYEEKKQTLVKQEQRRASHILLSLDADADAASVEAAQAKATDLLKRIRGGESFEDVARENSEDPGSAEKGGDLGFFARGAMVPEFEEKVFTMQPGEISEPVRSQFGFHIIKLVDIKASKIPSFEEVKTELEQELKNREAEDIYYSKIEELTDLAYENADSLQPAADALGMTVEHSDWIWAGNQAGISRYPEVIAAAFSDDVLDAGNNSEPIELDNEETIVLRVTDHQEAQVKAFKDVESAILTDLKVRKAAQLAKQKGEALLEQVRNGVTLKSLEKAEQQVYTEARDVSLVTPGYKQYLLKKVFQMKKPQGQEPRIEGYSLLDGDYVLVALQAVKDVDASKIAATDSEQLRRGIEDVQKNAALTALVEDLRQKAVIEIPEDTQQ